MEFRKKTMSTDLRVHNAKGTNLRAIVHDVSLPPFEILRFLKLQRKNLISSQLWFRGHWENSITNHHQGLTQQFWNSMHHVQWQWPTQVSRSNTATHFKQTPIFVTTMFLDLPLTDPKYTCLKYIGLHARDLLVILGSIVGGPI